MEGWQEKRIDAAFECMNQEMETARRNRTVVEGRPTIARALEAADEAVPVVPMEEVKELYQAASRLSKIGLGPLYLDRAVVNFTAPEDW